MVRGGPSGKWAAGGKFVGKVRRTDCAGAVKRETKLLSAILLTVLDLLSYVFFSL